MIRKFVILSLACAALITSPNVGAEERSTTTWVAVTVHNESSHDIQSLYLWPMSQGNSIVGRDYGRIPVGTQKYVRIESYLTSQVGCSFWYYWLFTNGDGGKAYLDICQQDDVYIYY